MSLFLSFRPRDGLLIGGKEFNVDATAGRLIADDGVVVEVTDRNVSPVREVLVRVSNLKFQAPLTLTFTAPRGTRILRVREEDTL